MNRDSSYDIIKAIIDSDEYNLKLELYHFLMKNRENLKDKIDAIDGAIDSLGDELEHSSLFDYSRKRRR